MVLEGLKTPSHFCVYVTNSDCYIYIYIYSGNEEVDHVKIVYFMLVEM